MSGGIVDIGAVELQMPDPALSQSRASDGTVIENVRLSHSSAVQILQNFQVAIYRRPARRDPVRLQLFDNGDERQFQPESEMPHKAAATSILLNRLVHMPLSYLPSGLRVPARLPVAPSNFRQTGGIGG
jgi:hypothetical protein